MYTIYTNHNSMADDNQMLFNLRYAKISYFVCYFIAETKQGIMKQSKKYHKYTFLYIRFARNTEGERKKCH